MAAKILVTFSLLFAVFYNIDISILQEIILRANLWHLVAAVLLYTMTFVIGGIRWHGINSSFGYATTLGFCIRISFVGGFFSQFLVGGGYGGDIYRAWALARNIGRTLKSFITVFIDRASGFVGAMLLVACLAPIYSVLFPAHAVFLLKVSMVCAFVIAMLIFIAWVGRYRSYAFINGVLGETLTYKINEISHDLAEGFLRWPTSLIHLGWSLVALVLNMLAIAAIGGSLGINLDLWVYLTLGPLVFLAKSFPLSFAGWGARELAMIFVFGLVGVDDTGAIAMSLLVGVLILVASVPGGVFWLLNKELKPVVSG